MCPGLNNETEGLRNTSEMAVTGPSQVLSSQSSTAATPHAPAHEVFARGSGIIPGALAAAVFIGFLLVLYGLLWKCMVSPPKRKKNRVKVRQQRTLVC